MSIEFKGSHFERDVILWGVRWYVAYPLSYRQIEEMMQERGVEVDHSALHRYIAGNPLTVEGSVALYPDLMYTPFTSGSENPLVR
jgi:hypothetical protein